MTTVYNKAPLVELIAELRWLPLGVTEAPAQQQAAPMLLMTDAKVEEFFMRLGAELYQSGFQRSERLIPHGFPIVFGQPAIRFRSDDKAKKSVLYQVGSSVFSVHATPPYRTWQDFEPQVKVGVDALLKTRVEGLEHAPFTQVSLRYLDFFGEELMGGRSMEVFTSEVLGFCTTMPPALTEVAAPKELRSVFLRFVVPLEIGTLTVSVGDGKSQNQSGVVLDTTVATSKHLRPSSDAIMMIFSSAHEIVGKTFLAFTKKIEDLMEPAKVKN